jgi:hypothetical protein
LLNLRYDAGSGHPGTTEDFGTDDRFQGHADVAALHHQPFNVDARKQPLSTYRSCGPLPSFSIIRSGPWLKLLNAMPWRSPLERCFAAGTRREADNGPIRERPT